MQLRLLDKQVLPCSLASSQTTRARSLTRAPAASAGAAAGVPHSKHRFHLGAALARLGSMVRDGVGGDLPQRGAGAPEDGGGDDLSGGGRAQRPSSSQRHGMRERRGKRTGQGKFASTIQPPCRGGVTSIELSRPAEVAATAPQLPAPSCKCPRSPAQLLPRQGHPPHPPPRSGTPRCSTTCPPGHQSAGGRSALPPGRPAPAGKRGRRMVEESRCGGVQQLHWLSKQVG